MLTKLKIENMIEQHKAQVASVKEQQKAAAPQAAEIDPALTAGFVAVAAGDGVQQLFRDLGVQQIVSGGQTMNPSTEDILHAAEQVPAMDVYVLPNNKNIVMAAEQAARAGPDQRCAAHPCGADHDHPAGDQRHDGL